MGDSLYWNKKLIWKRLIKLNETETALVAFMRWSDDTSLDDKLEQIEEIEKRGNFGKEVQTGFKFIKENGMFQDQEIKTNIPIFMRFCEQKMEPEFLQRIFGKSFKIEDKITWRYQKDGRKIWMAESCRNSDINGKVIIQRIAGNTQVNYVFGKKIFLLFMQKLFVF